MKFAGMSNRLLNSQKLYSRLDNLLPNLQKHYSKMGDVSPSSQKCYRAHHDFDYPSTMTFANPGPDEICHMLSSIRTIAVIGLSPNPARPSHRVARAMQGNGYRIVPVRPLVKEVLGELAYTDLESIPFKVDMVDVFRAPQHVPAIVESCIALGIPRLWLQDGVVHEEAAQRAQAAGIEVVMDRCIWRDYSQLCAL